MPQKENIMKICKKYIMKNVIRQIKQQMCLKLFFMCNSFLNLCKQVGSLLRHVRALWATVQAYFSFQ